MIFKTDLETYYKFKKSISEIYPQLTVKLISQDPMLKNLGFIDKVPCEIELYATDEQFDELWNRVLQFEIDAYNTPDGENPPENDPNYILYCKYQWLESFLLQNNE